MSIAPEQYPLVVLVIAGLLVAALFFRRHFWALIEEKAASEEKPASKLYSLQDDPDELFKLRVELHEVSRDIKGELDSKIAILHQLVVQAKRETARLEAALEQSRRRDAA